ncbi:MAG: glycoside hydrolase family 16 protein [bacterium]|nr:glycoside hydrolase family 16 protein [bacterium]
MNLKVVVKRIFLAVVFIASFAVCALAQNWQSTWSDEFTNGIGSDWVFEEGNGFEGWGNWELEYYQASNASVENGVLMITAKEEDAGGYEYTSARMKTQGNFSFQYGRIEARIAVPSVTGLWPAFWMLGNTIADTDVTWPACGEIDVMEHKNTDSYIEGTMHWKDHTETDVKYGGPVTTDSTEFHVYAVEWDAVEIRWYLDGVQYHVANIENGVNGTDELHNESFILLNIAVGGNHPGNIIDESKLPAIMQVDYVRVYQDGGNTQGFLGSESDYNTEASSSAFTFTSNVTSTWADVHFKINGGGQMNHRMSADGNVHTHALSGLNNGDLVSYYFTYEKNGLAYNSPWKSFSVNDIGAGGTPNDGCSDSEVDYSYSINSAAITFESNVYSIWGDVHYKINGGGQMNYRMTADGNTHTQSLSGVTEGDVIEYFFTYEKDGLAYSSPWYTCTIATQD